MNKKQWIKKKKKRRANADIISKLQFSIRSFLKLFTNICPKAHISKTLYNVIFTTLFNKIFICASVGSVFIGISKHLVKKKKKKPYQPMSLYQLQSRSSISGSICLSIQIGFRTPLP